MLQKCYYFVVLVLFGFSAQCQDTNGGQQLQITPLINGTLLLPSGEKPPLAIIIPGSGPTDRNGNQPMMKNNSLKQLSEGLTAKGIATFRYDKRLLALIKNNTIDEKKVRFDDFVKDAKAVIGFFRKKGYDKIILVGHSQGALVAELAALDNPVEKLVLLEGAGQPIDKIILDQLAQQAPGLTEDAAKAFKDLRKNGEAKDFSPGLMSLLRPDIQPFMLSWMRHDPAKILKKIDIPILVISGSKDLQVAPSEGKLLAEANPKAQFTEIKGMNHVLKKIDGGDLENSKSYSESAKTIMPEVIGCIAEFIMNQQNLAN